MRRRWWPVIAHFNRDEEEFPMKALIDSLLRRAANRIFCAMEADVDGLIVGTQQRARDLAQRLSRPFAGYPQT
jgi:hypothetical protein